MMRVRVLGREPVTLALPFPLSRGLDGPSPDAISISSVIQYKQLFNETLQYILNIKFSNLRQLSYSIHK